MKENKEIEKILLNDTKFDNIIKSKIEKEFIAEIGNNKKVCTKEINDIKKAPKDKIFSKQAVYIIMNKNSKTKSYINGMQAEGFLGTQKADRENLLTGKSDAFVSGNNFIKFIKVKL